MGAKPYPVYKDSGVEWIGEIPEHWEVKKLKDALTRNDGGCWGEDASAESGTMVLRSTEQTVDGNWSITDPAYRHLSQREIEECTLQVGDLVMTKSSGSSAHIGKTTLVDTSIAELRPAYSNFMQRLRVSDSNLPKFHWYILNNSIARIQFDFYSNTTTGLANLNEKIIGLVHLPFPPLEEQKQIASFLDRETSKIDTLIEKQQQLINLLKEKRGSLISHTFFTLESTGTIQLRNVCRVITKGTTPTTMGFDFCSSGVNFVRVDSLSDRGELLPETFAFIDENTQLALKRSQLLEQDLLVSITGSIGKTAVVTSQILPANTSQNVAIVRLKLSLLLPRFLQLFWQSADCSEQIREKTLLSVQASITLETIGKVRIPFPPLEEQKQIASFLDRETFKIDTLIEKANQSITLLKERRSSLISAAVTGKIDVREAA